jgi:hypothetical protein
MRRGMGMWWRGEGMEAEAEAVMEAEAEAGRMEVIAFHVIAFHGTPNATGGHADAVPEAPLGWHLARRLRCRFHGSDTLQTPDCLRLVRDGRAPGLLRFGRSRRW